MIFRAIALAVLLAAPAFAEGTPTPAASPSPVDATMANFGVHNDDCLEWTDACAVCKRDDAGVANCSTPGIACQAKPIVCSKAKTP